MEPAGTMEYLLTGSKELRQAVNQIRVDHGRSAATFGQPTVSSAWMDAFPQTPQLELK
jgi:hypothetical protein